MLASRYLFEAVAYTGAAVLVAIGAVGADGAVPGHACNRGPTCEGTSQPGIAQVRIREVGTLQVGEVQACTR